MRTHAKRLLSLLTALVMILGLLPAVSAAEHISTWDVSLPAEEAADAEIPIPNGDFENGVEGWTFDGLTGEIIDNGSSAINATKVLNLWVSNEEAVSISARYSVWLTAGTYHFSFDMDGENKDGHLQAGVKNGETSLELVSYPVTLGWDNWFTTTMEEFTLTEPAKITFWLSGTIPAGYWAHLDNLKLFGTGEIYVPMEEIELPNGDFENGAAGWTFTGLTGEIIDNNYSATHATHVLNLWASETEQVEISVNYAVKLTAGTYKFTFDADGAEADSLLHYAVRSGEETLFSSEDSIVTTGWDNWTTLETGPVTLTADTEIVFTVFGTGPAGYWGHLDNLKLFGTGAIAGEEQAFDHEPTIAVEKVNGVESDDFMRGTDVSSYLSIVNSGAKFYDYEGNELDNQGFFDLLAAAGFNYIRLRVWNDPFDAQGRGYGGGNCDVEAAKTMGVWATNAGMKVLVDFHYSDFWADPGKQKVPKAWAGYTADQKAEAVDAFTYTSLKTLLDAGVDVGMVQVGNETTGSICGESSWANKAKIFSAGSAAIRRISAEYEHPILVAIHFTNPERSGNYASQAKNLNDNNVDYDVFASSWYPYWHGTLSNLTSVLKQVADTYGKQVVVAETSWAWTLDDGDGHDNTVRNGNNSSNNAYPFTVQGQADELVSVAKSVKAVGTAGVGVFYWENAWIPVQYAYDEDGNLDNAILTSNKAKWEEFGSGWASSYAAEYDPNDAGVWFGGSAVDNQANFDFNGKALDSLWTWKYMMVGTEEAVEQEIVSIDIPELVLAQGAALNLPATLAVTYLVGGVANDPVVWNEADVAAVDVNTPGRYTVHGVLTTQLGEQNVILSVTVNHPNLLQNFDFEDSDLSMYTFSGNYDWSTDTPHGGNRCLHFYNAAAKSLDFSQTVTLEPGDYVFSLYAQGDAKGGTEQYIYVTLSDGTLTQDYALAGWAVWQHPELRFSVTETASVTVGAYIAYGAGGWGTFDDLYLGLSAEAPPTPEPVIDLFFVDETGLSAMYCYAFGESGEQTAWPGTALESIGKDVHGKDVYEIEVDAGAFDHVIFTDGSGWQTVDLPFTEDAGENAWIVYFGNSNEADEQGHYKAWPAEDVEKIVSRTEPNCTEDGVTVYESFVTGAQRTETVGALDHDWDEGVITTDPSVEADGVKTYTCRRCGETRAEFVPFRFDDVSDPEKYYFEPVYWALRHDPQITAGMSETLFGVKNNCTRAQIVTFLWNAFGAPEPKNTNNPFTDVEESKYYFKAVLWAVEEEISSGMTPTTFGVKDTCTRADAMTFLWAASGRPEPETTDNPFTDVPESKYYYKAVLWAVENGVTSGTTPTTFSPKNTCTRAQIVTFLYAALNK